MVVRGFHKKASKRITTRKRTKIERKVREHERKLRKSAKTKRRPSKVKRMRKDPGIPNECPFKQDILDEAKRMREQREQLKEQGKQRKKEARKMNQTMAGPQEVCGLEEMAQNAKARSLQFEIAQLEEQYREETGFVPDMSKSYKENKRSVEQSRKQYGREFKKVINEADVILEVLDARDPLGSRCPQVERAVLEAGHNKKLVLVLNKIDLVPKDNVEAWLKYLRNELPTIAFKASTQENLGKTGKLSQVKVPLSKAETGLIKSSTCLGADTLMKLIANYSRSKDLKTAVRVGVVGFPNTGKSSIINSLKRGKACVVGNTPGVTKVMQTIQLDKNVQLIDCPGVVMADESEGQNVLRNAVKVEKIDDPMQPLELLLARCQKEKMMTQYQIPLYQDISGFINSVAHRFGFIKKKGIPDRDTAARRVLNDWNSGKISYHTLPPNTYTRSTHISADVVSNLAKEFDINGLLGEENSMITVLESDIPDTMIVDQTGPTDGTERVEADVEHGASGDMEQDVDIMDLVKHKQQVTMVTQVKKQPKAASKQPGNNIVQNKKKGKNALSEFLPKRQTKRSQAIATRSPVFPEDLQLNKQKKKQYKKMQKNKKRTEKLDNDLSNALETGLAV